MYKIVELDKTDIKRITVFHGKSDENLDELFEEDPANPLFKDLFSQTELKNIKTNSVPIVFSEQRIYPDDSIWLIKLKLMREYRTVSHEEIYLFNLKREILDASAVYQSLTQNNKLKLTRVVMEQFLKNIWRFSGKLEEKETYTFDDILKLKLEDSYSLMHRCIGQRFFAVTNEYQFCINPFMVSEYDEFIEKLT